MNRFALFLSEIFLHAKQRQAFLEWMLFLSLFFLADFMLNWYLLRYIDMLNLVVIVLVSHLLYFIWLVVLLVEDGSRLRAMLHQGQYRARTFQIFFSRLIPIFFLLSPGIGAVGLGFLFVFLLSRPIGWLMSRRAKIDWESVYELLRLEEERL
ncbi:hypothetical protein [Entomospira culicis]|uniref:Uncharacterized protein n=1 Tax=Entomospira culicis TaxID=2719989 RepID=A0A968GGW3_9SPIO|nr:hypothetical protein [Entomospira culicis]NIZ18558.1 hypothetical protein [Entomospira culicis]NIZ68774.1 hypothetical protein [Entomospira culicis]WDI37370.1 hypothetical protein PVA46_00865 [Entomospira culicis]WDI38999.1 hypothetical protein PVA47_00875 [Entomospira culicis]